MSLKDEIEKLIKTEQEKLDKHDQEFRDYCERQNQRFTHMRVVIEEISKSIEPEYLNISIYDSLGTIMIGDRKSGYFKQEVCLEIEPNYKMQQDKGMLAEESGFRVKETLTFNYPGGGVPSVHTYIFKDEQSTTEYLVKKIGEKVGLYRHLETLVKDPASMK